MGRSHGMQLVGTPESFVYLQVPWLGPGYKMPFQGVGAKIDRQDFSVAPNDKLSIKKHDEQAGLKNFVRVIFGEVGWGKSTDVKSDVVLYSTISVGDYEPVIDLHDKKLEHEVEIEAEAERVALLESDPDAELGPLKELERVGEWFPTGQWLGNDQVDVWKIRSNCFDTLLIKRGHQALDIAQETAVFGNRGPIPLEWNFYYHVTMFIMMRDYFDLANPELFWRLLLDLRMQDVRDYLADAYRTPIMGFDEYFGDKVLASLDEKERLRRLAARERVGVDHIRNYDGISEAEVRAGVFQAALPWDYVLRGSDGPIVGQGSLVSVLRETSSCPTVRRRGKTYNWAGMTPRATGYVKGLLAKFQVIDQTTVGGGLLTPDREVYDEDPSNWNELAHARWMTEKFKFGRRDGTEYDLLAHRPADYFAVGEVGSEQRQLAKNFMDEVTQKTFYHQRSSLVNRRELADAFGMDDELIQYATQQRVGESVDIIGSLPPHKNSLPLSEIERYISFTENALGRKLNRRQHLIGKPHEPAELR